MNTFKPPIMPYEKGGFQFGQGGYAFRAFALAESADGRQIDARTASLVHQITDSISDDLGSGKRLSLTYEADNGLVLVQHVAQYENRQQFVVWAVLSDKSGAEIESRFIAPFCTYAPNDQSPMALRKHSLRMLTAPYDNTMWVRYEMIPMRPGRLSYEFAGLCDPDARNGLVIGAMDHDNWKNAIRCSGYDARCVEAFSGVADGATHDTMPHGTIAGKSIKSARFSVEYCEDIFAGLNRYGELLKEINPPIEWNDGVPFGWNSWSGLAFRLNLENYANAGEVLNELKSHDYQNRGTNYVNLDSGWNSMPEDKLIATVNEIHSRGQRAGIYGTPFAFWGNPDDEIKQLPGHKWSELLLCDEHGKPLPRVDGAIPMDVTHPLWREVTAIQLANYVKWGFDYVKFDFLSHGGMEGVHYDKSVRTGRQAINIGYAFVRDALAKEKIGRDFFISLSIAPLFPAGYGHARRFSCDAFGHTEDTEYLLNALTYGWWQHENLYALNDPDHITLTRSFMDSENTTITEARARYTAAAISGTVMMISDDYGPSGDEAVHAESLRRAKLFATNKKVNDVARLGKTFVPTHTAGVSASETYTLQHDGKLYLAAFNFDAEPKHMRIDLAEIGIKNATKATELWTDATYPVNGDLTITLDAGDAALFIVE